MLMSSSSSAVAAAALGHRVQVEGKAVQEGAKPLLIGGAQSREYVFDLCRVAAEHAPDEPLPARRELHELGPLVDRGCAATDQTHPMESVDHSRDAGRADEQPIAEIGQPQRPQ